MDVLAGDVFAKVVDVVTHMGGYSLRTTLRAIAAAPLIRRKVQQLPIIGKCVNLCRDFLINYWRSG